jgi:hypothetical protein
MVGWQSPNEEVSQRTALGRLLWKQRPGRPFEHLPQRLMQARHRAQVKRQSQAAMRQGTGASTPNFQFGRRNNIVLTRRIGNSGYSC